MYPRSNRRAELEHGQSYCPTSVVGIIARSTIVLTVHHEHGTTHTNALSQINVLHTGLVVDVTP